jgi:hypothetical protein
MMIAPRTQRTVAHDQMSRLAAWNARKPVIAIMGEFSAGKSTLLNMLIGQAILPTQVTATKLPPVWLRHGTDEPYRVDKANRRHPIDLNDLASVPVKDTRYIRIFCQAEVLESCDLLDTPGISDPNIPMHWWIKSIGYANAVLWCSHAGQAWRESERSAWESLPERLRRHSLLLVTRADKINSDIDRMKIDTRLRRETESLFGGRLFISLTSALRALEGDGDAALWTSSGAEVFVDMLANSIAAINDDRSVAIRRYRVDPSALERVTPRRVRPASSLVPDGEHTSREARPVGGADVVPMRPMRVVATNESPVEAAPGSVRPALHQVNSVADATDAVLVLDTPIDPSPAVDAANEIDLTTNEAAVEPADLMAEQSEAIEYIEYSDADLGFSADEPQPESLALTADSEDFAGVSALTLLEDALNDQSLTVDEHAPSEDPPSHASISDEALVTDDEAEEFEPPTMIAGFHYQEVLHEDLALESDYLDPLTIMAKLSNPETAKLFADGKELMPAPSAEDSIGAVMAEFAIDEIHQPKTGPELVDVAQAAPLTATSLWQDALANRQVETVQDVLSAMADFVAMLDASGFQVGHRPDNSSDQDHGVRADADLT